MGFKFGFVGLTEQSRIGQGDTSSPASRELLLKEKPRVPRPKRSFYIKGCGYRSLLLEEKVSAKPTDEVAPKHILICSVKQFDKPQFEPHKQR